MGVLGIILVVIEVVTACFTVYSLVDDYYQKRGSSANKEIVKATRKTWRGLKATARHAFYTGQMTLQVIGVAIKKAYSRVHRWHRAKGKRTSVAFDDVYPEIIKQLKRSYPYGPPEKVQKEIECVRLNAYR